MQQDSQIMRSQLHGILRLDHQHLTAIFKKPEIHTFDSVGSDIRDIWVKTLQNTGKMTNAGFARTVNDYDDTNGAQA